MADTSGSFAGNFVTISSPYGGYIWTQWQLASQNVGGDYSTINWQTYFHFGGSDAQLDNGSVNSNVGGLWSNGGRVYNYSGNFSTRDMGLASGSFNVGHDGAGNGQLQLSNSIAVYGSGTSAATSGVWNLPTIPRYANFTAYNILNVTDSGFTIQIAADNYCSDIAYSIDNGASYTSLGAGSSANAYLTNLPSGVTYNIYARIIRSDSGLTTYSGLAQATTALQNNFIGLLL